MTIRLYDPDACLSKEEISEKLNKLTQWDMCSGWCGGEMIPLKKHGDYLCIEDVCEALGIQTVEGKFSP